MQLMHFNTADLFLLLSQLLLEVWVRHAKIRITKQSPVPCVAFESIVTQHSEAQEHSTVTKQSRVRDKRACVECGEEKLLEEIYQKKLEIMKLLVTHIRPLLMGAKNKNKNARKFAFLFFTRQKRPKSKKRGLVFDFFG